LAIVAGIAYGGFLGGLLTVIGSTVGASISFVLGRTLLRDEVIKKYGDKPTFNKIMNGVNENGVSFLILTRLVPIFPYASELCLCIDSDGILEIFNDIRFNNASSLFYLCLYGI
jgi:Uncharacterized conserved protein